MIRVKVQTDFSGAFRVLDDVKKQVRYATAVALTKTAQIAEKDVKKTMPEVFNQPTRWTLNATRVIPATKQNLTAQVWLKDRSGGAAKKDTAFLYPEIFGGGRGRKGFEGALLKAGAIRSNEYCVPANGAPLDSFGNVPASLIRQILSQLQAAEKSAGYTANVKKGAAQSAQSKRRQKKAGTFFIPEAGSGLPRGIYQRILGGFGWSHRMIFKIVVGKPRYAIRLRIGDIGKRVADKYFQSEFDTAFDQAMKTAR